MLKKLFVIISLVCISIYCNSQPHRFFSVGSGLSNSRINTIAQDSDGYIWIGTEDGLNRFDGNRFVTYRNHPGDSTSLISNSIKKIYEDSSRRLWICTMKGICIYDRTMDCFEPFRVALDDERLLANQINTIAEDKEGHIWISISNHGLVCLDASGKELFHLDSGNSTLVSNHVNCILEDKDGVLWLGTESGLNSYDRSKSELSTHYIVPGTAFPKVTSLCEDEYGNVWIGTLDNGVIVYDSETDSFQNLNDETQEEQKEVCALLEDGDKMWVSLFDKGFRLFSTSSRKEVGIGLSVPEVNVAQGTCHSLFKDRQGNIWAGLFMRGLLLFVSESQMFTNYQYNPFLPNSIADGAIVPVCCDSEGEIWLGKDGGGFYRMDKDKKIISFFNNEDDKRKSIVVSMYEDSDKDMWIGTYLDGAMRFNRRKQQVDLHLHAGKGPGTLLSSHVTDFAETEDGRLWIATNGGGVNIYNPADGSFEYLYKQENDTSDNQLVDNWCNKLLIDSDGMLWIGTFNGISVYDIARQCFSAHYKDQLPDKVIFSLYEDVNGNIWAGTQGGLACILKSGGGIKTYGLENGLPNTSINGILGDDAGNLWFSTGDGISMFNLETEKFENYSTDKGMASSDCNAKSFDVTPEGEFIIGTTEGFTTFFPANRSMQGDEPINLMFTDLYVHNNKVAVSSGKRSILKRSLNHTDRLTFKSDQNSFSVSFSAIEYSLPQNINYEVYLEGFDKKWQPAGNRMATYTNLDSGNYTLHVRAWKDNPEKSLQKDLEICVLPPIWATVWAKLLYLILFAAFVSVVYYYWKKEQARKQQEEQLNDRLQFFTDISHEIRTPLTMIMAPLGKLIAQNPNSSVLPVYNMMYKHANRLLFLVNQVIDLSSLTKKHLHVEKTEICRFVEDITNSFAFTAEEKGLSLAFHSVPGSIVGYVDQDILSKILYNLISNAIKYTEEGNVKVELAMEESSMLSIKVSDTGRGIPESMQNKVFERFFMIEGTPGKNRKISSGIGLHLTSRIVQFHHGKIWLDSEDGRGSVFTILLPVAAEYYSDDEFSSFSAAGVADGGDGLAHEFEHDSVAGPVTAKDKPAPLRKILVIEDDADIRGLISGEFSREFSVIEADNGKEGLLKCMEAGPDLVICDVLMPEMSGLEFCRKIRNNDTFRNIPIILLTARSAPAQQTEGLMSGADAYLTKPFNLGYLNAMVHRFLKRAESEARPVEKNGIPDENRGPSADDLMLQRINGLIEANIDNPEFDVDSFSRELALSRTHLNRKVRELTGESPASYIKQIRLRKAANLLADDSLTISEIAYMTGFSSPSYFSQAFREYYGVSPKEFTLK